MDGIGLVEFSRTLGRLARPLRKGHKMASRQEWAEAGRSYREASETLSPGGPIWRKLVDMAERMERLASDPPTFKPLA
jgi:hypothetical protein